MKEKIIELIKKYYIYIIICIILLLILIVILFKPNKKNKEIKEIEIVEKETENKVIEETKQVEKLFKVDIKGAVTTPGVYEVKENTRVSDVIYLAGGYIENADTSYINLSKKVVDEMVIIIYTVDQIRQYQEKNKPIEKLEIKYVCPDEINNSCIENNEQKENNSNKTNTLISLNNATSEQLQTLSGIGEAKALLIIEYRNNKKIEKIEELREIKGIGDSIFEKIKDNITI